MRGATADFVRFFKQNAPKNQKNVKKCKKVMDSSADFVRFFSIKSKKFYKIEIL